MQDDLGLKLFMAVQGFTDIEGARKAYIHFMDEYEEIADRLTQLYIDEPDPIADAVEDIESFVEGMTALADVLSTLKVPEDLGFNDDMMYGANVTLAVMNTAAQHTISTVTNFSDGVIDIAETLSAIVDSVKASR